MNGGENDSGELRQYTAGDGDDDVKVVTFEQLLESVEVTDKQIQLQEFGDSEESSDEEEEKDGENNSNESDEKVQIEEDDNDDDDDSEAEAEAETEKPKLAEGFYEIESVRSKRVRKGQVQYLIKWRGWPETANTWEPVQNLMACSDVIDSFEESLHSVKLQSGCGRKRKSVASQTQINKEQQQQQHSPAAATDNVPAVKVRVIEERIPSPQDGSNGKNHVDSNGSSFNNIKGYGPVNGNDLKVDSSLKEVKEHYELDVKLNELKEEQNELDSKLSELKGSPVTNGTSVDISRDGLTNGFAKANGAESLRSGRAVGAKKRKSGSVRRFKQETTSGVSGDDAVTNAASGPSGIFFQEQIYNPEFVDLGCRNKCGDSLTITQIIRPLSYLKDVHGVSMTFLAKRSDGATVVVDNKFMKTHNPLPLISFYEQHLRYER